MTRCRHPKKCCTAWLVGSPKLWLVTCRRCHRHVGYLNPQDEYPRDLLPMVSR